MNFTKLKVAIYVPDRAAKKAYKTESFNVRAQLGMSTIKDVLLRHGWDINYASKATVDRYDVVLISVTSQVDWWQLIAERITWPAGHYTTVLGGPGVMNVRPFLGWFDLFVLGRAEDTIVELLDNLQDYENDSVIRSSTFDPDSTYQIRQAESLYPHPVALENGKQWTETSIGCPYQCHFCAYTWHRRHLGGKSFYSGTGIFSADNRERTIVDLLKLPAARWQEEGSLRIVGLDGFSERLRAKVCNKRITDKMLREFFTCLASVEPPHQIKIYNIVGLPGETDADWQEFMETLRDVDTALAPEPKQWSLVLHNTPFRPMPATPAAGWPVAREEYRGRVAERLRAGKWMKGNIFYQGNRYWAVESMGTDSLSTVLLDMLVLRGIEDDAGLIRNIATNRQFWASSALQRRLTLERYADIDRLCRAYAPEDLPTAYLRTYRIVPNKVLLPA